MSNAEEIAEEIIQEYPPSIISKKERWGRVAIKNMMQAHTNQTLQELKAKVEDKRDEQLDKYKEAFSQTHDEALAFGRMKAFGTVLQLIEEAINE